MNLILTKMSLLNYEGSGFKALRDILVPGSGELAASDKAYNMITMSTMLHRYWGQCYFALRYMGNETPIKDSGPELPPQVRSTRSSPQATAGSSTQTPMTKYTEYDVQFVWMPKNIPDALGPLARAGSGPVYHRTFDLDSKNADQMTSSLRQALGNPRTEERRDRTEGRQKKAVRDIHGRALESGHIITLKVATKDLPKVKALIEAQFVITKMGAFSGAGEAPEELNTEPPPSPTIPMRPGLSDEASSKADMAIAATDIASPAADNDLPATDNASVAAHNAPDEADDALDEADNASVATDNAPVSIDNVPVATHNAPGAAGNAPEEAGNAPDEADNAPVATDNAPGAAGNAPDEAMNAPDEASSKAGSAKGRLRKAMSRLSLLGGLRKATSKLSSSHRKGAEGQSGGGEGQDRLPSGPRFSSRPNTPARDKTAQDQAQDQQTKKKRALEDEAAWVKLTKITYQDPAGQTRTWESAERRTRPRDSDIDAVGIVAILQTDDGPSIVLQKQYRPPVDRIAIEVPAGLVDAGETPEQAAVRELKEETGYVGVVSETSPVMFNDPGFCNTNTRMVHVTVDMALPANQNPVPELEENEFIEVFTAPLATLWDTCKRLEAEGYAIDARVGTLAEGVELAKTWKL
ncbi:hypothetical protein ACHAQA_006789 [Verticillium albo-atrum]